MCVSQAPYSPHEPYACGMNETSGVTSVSVCARVCVGLYGMCVCARVSICLFLHEFLR